MLTPPARPPSPSARRSNAAVSVLLGQRWRDMHSTEKACYVAAARKIKEDFVVTNPEARRGTGRKKRKQLDGAHDRMGAKVPRSFAPPSLHALALVGSRLNQEPHQPGAPSFGHPDHAAEDSSQQPPLCAPSLSLLDQLCTVAENEHNAAAQMLSSLAAF